jgi:formate--tetrahydrofolate ligase
VLEAAGYGHSPVCVAKTQYSFSTDPGARGAPSGHTLNIREVRLAAGAEFIVRVCGDVMTMPGLPKVPSEVESFSRSCQSSASEDIRSRRKAQP